DAAGGRGGSEALTALPARHLEERPDVRLECAGRARVVRQAQGTGESRARPAAEVEVAAAQRARTEDEALAWQQQPADERPLRQFVGGFPRAWSDAGQ